MCGITGIVVRETSTSTPVSRLILSGLQNLEYRGYDSVGIAVLDSDTDTDSMTVRKGAGKIAENVVRLRLKSIRGHTAIGHTRWATHGAPNDENAHPHLSCDGNIAVVHNGIISNYLELRKELIAKGHKFNSDTDTEVIPHLLEKYLTFFLL